VASKVQIYNLAAELIGTEARVTDPDEDRPLARNISAVWDTQRRATLRDGSWNFAIRRDALASLAGITAYPYEYAFRLPADAARLLEILTPEARADYALEGQRILCNVAGPLYVRCVIDVTEPALWDDSFADSFARRIAFTIGTRIAGSAYNPQDGWQAYQKSLSDAKSVDARENPPLVQEESDWVLARFGRSGIGP